MSTTTYKSGVSVRFTRGPLGLVTTAEQTYFEPETVKAGDTGSYLKPHPSLNEPGWHLVRVEIDGRKLLCPCHEYQFEAIEGGA
jgi:hypothetical protein